MSLLSIFGFGKIHYFHVSWKLKTHNIFWCKIYSWIIMDVWMFLLAMVLSTIVKLRWWKDDNERPMQWGPVQLGAEFCLLWESNPIHHDMKLRALSVQPTKYIFQIEPAHDKTNKMARVTSKNSDQLGHLPSLIRVFAVCSILDLQDVIIIWSSTRQNLQENLWDQQRLRSTCTATHHGKGSYLFLLG